MALWILLLLPCHLLLFVYLNPQISVFLPTSYSAFSGRNRNLPILACLKSRIFKGIQKRISSVQRLSHVWVFVPMDCSTPGLPVHRLLLELTQTHVHWVSDAIQPSHPLLSSASPSFNLSQHQGLFQWVSSSHQVAKVLEFQLQHQSFKW